jgi:CHAT domain
VAPAINFDAVSVQRQPRCPWRASQLDKTAPSAGAGNSSHEGGAYLRGSAREERLVTMPYLRNSRGSMLRHAESGGASPSACAGPSVPPLDISSYRARATWIAAAWCSRRSRAPPTRPKRCKGCRAQLVVLPPARPNWGRCNRARGCTGFRRVLVLAGAQAQLVSLSKVVDARTRALIVEYDQCVLTG